MAGSSGLEPEGGHGETHILVGLVVRTERPQMAAIGLAERLRVGVLGRGAVVELDREAAARLLNETAARVLVCGRSLLALTSHEDGPGMAEGWHRISSIL